MLHDHTLLHDNTILCDYTILRNHTILHDHTILRDHTVLHDHTLLHDHTILRDKNFFLSGRVSTCLCVCLYPPLLAHVCLSKIIKGQLFINLNNFLARGKLRKIPRICSLTLKFLFLSLFTPPPFPIVPFPPCTFPYCSFPPYFLSLLPVACSLFPFPVPFPCSLSLFSFPSISLRHQYSMLIMLILLSVASIWRKLLKTTNTEERLEMR